MANDILKTTGNEGGVSADDTELVVTRGCCPYGASKDHKVPGDAKA